MIMIMVMRVVMIMFMRVLLLVVMRMLMLMVMIMAVLTDLAIYFAVQRQAAATFSAHRISPFSKSGHAYTID